MSNYRSKNSNKKFDNKQILNTINRDNSTSCELSKSKQIRNFVSFTTPILEKQQTFETSVEWEQILDREFQSLDIDADGYVSIADLQSVLKNFSHIYNSNEIMLRILKELDVNHDQRISKQEFKLYKKILLDHKKCFNHSLLEEKFGSIFNLFDRNKDNYISPHEIRETMKNLGENLDENLLNEMMQTADIDHDGRISRDEFEKLILQLHLKE